MSNRSKSDDRFHCPFPDCHRSFAELWRLKVHYRAPVDARGSGIERGHGVELPYCPKCGVELHPRKHHTTCSTLVTTAAARTSVKRPRISSDPQGGRSDADAADAGAGPRASSAIELKREVSEEAPDTAEGHRGAAHVGPQALPHITLGAPPSLLSTLNPLNPLGGLTLQTMQGLQALQGLQGVILAHQGNMGHYHAAALQMAAAAQPAGPGPAPLQVSVPASKAPEPSSAPSASEGMAESAAATAGTGGQAPPLGLDALASGIDALARAAELEAADDEDKQQPRSATVRGGQGAAQQQLPPQPNSAPAAMMGGGIQAMLAAGQQGQPAMAALQQFGLQGLQGIQGVCGPMVLYPGGGMQGVPQLFLTPSGQVVSYSAPMGYPQMMSMGGVGAFSAMQPLVQMQNMGPGQGAQQAGGAFLFGGR